MPVSQSGRDGLTPSSADQEGSDTPPARDAIDRRSPEELRAILVTVTQENGQLKKQIADLHLEQRHAAMIHRDHAIGITAELETLRERHTNAQLQLRRARDKALRLQKVVAEMRASSTWRVGRLLVRPFALLRGRTRS